MEQFKEEKPEMQIWHEQDLCINGLNLFGYCKFANAIQPLTEHFHENCLEFIFLLKGEDTYVIGDQSYLIHGGDIFVTLPNQSHASGKTHQGIGEYIWFQINPIDSLDFLGLDKETAKDLKVKLLKWNTHIFSGSNEIFTHVKKLYYAIRQKVDKLYCIGQIIIILSLILESMPNDCNADVSIRMALEYIQNNLNGNLSVPELSHLFGLSESGFKHKFKRETGYTPGDYINRTRISRAQELLISGYSVTRTSIETGFNSSDYFSKVFKKYTRQTPSEFIRSVSLE